MGPDSSPYEVQCEQLDFGKSMVCESQRFLRSVHCDSIGHGGIACTPLHESDPTDIGVGTSMSLRRHHETYQWGSRGGNVQGSLECCLSLQIPLSCGLAVFVSPPKAYVMSYTNIQISIVINTFAKIYDLVGLLS
jgi:hypothetical protein